MQKGKYFNSNLINITSYLEIFYRINFAVLDNSFLKKIAAHTLSISQPTDLCES